MKKVICWDIGGANLKASKFLFTKNGMKYQTSIKYYFPFWQNRNSFYEVLHKMNLKLKEADIMIIVITAELSDAFINKNEGILFIANAFNSAFNDKDIYFYDIDGFFTPFSKVKEHPVRYCATNWLAVANYIASQNLSCIILDIGSTTTDLIPVMEGKILAKGKTDLERLQNGELLYTGALRTNPNTFVSEVPIRGKMTPVAAEYFCTMADINLLLQNFDAEDYNIPTADGRGKKRIDASRRIAKLVCCDENELSETEIYTIAQYVYTKQAVKIANSISLIYSRIQHQLPLLPLDKAPTMVKDISSMLSVNTVQTEKIFPEDTVNFATTYSLGLNFISS